MNEVPNNNIFSDDAYNIARSHFDAPKVIEQTHRIVEAVYKSNELRKLTSVILSCEILNDRR